MPYYTKRSLNEWSFPQSQRHRRRQALPLPRAHPLLLQSTPCSTGYFAKCSVLTSFPILVLAHASFFAPRSYPSIWLTNISPTSYDELRSHPRTAPDADPDHDCRVSSSTMATSRLCNTCFQKASISMWRLRLRLRPPLPCTWRRPPLNHDILRRPNVSVRLKIFLLCCILGWERR